MQLKVKIRRYDPERPGKDRPYWQEFAVEAEPGDRLLDVLNQVKWYHDPTLAFRRSCAHGVCGSDAMVASPHRLRSGTGTKLPQSRSPLSGSMGGGVTRPECSTALWPEKGYAGCTSAFPVRHRPRPSTVLPHQQPSRVRRSPGQRRHGGRPAQDRHRRTE